MFKEAGAPVDSYAVGSYISGASPIDFTGDIKEIDGRPIAKRGRIPGLTELPRLEPIDLSVYREGYRRRCPGARRRRPAAPGPGARLPAAPAPVRPPSTQARWACVLCPAPAGPPRKPTA